MKNCVKLTIILFVLLVSVSLIVYVGHSAKTSNTTINGMFSYVHNDAAKNDEIELLITLIDTCNNYNNFIVDTIIKVAADGLCIRNIYWRFLF